ncbi:MAG: glycosyltransferase family 4 protein [Candidatus Levybacteria bacterium]|nr:glycosyltransferase family 4 protein [Candidatus Levybacteria bacterium]
MKIVLLSPPWIPLPPKGYGGIENIVYNLAQGLQKKGHEVIVYATGDSKISGELRYLYQKSLGIDTLLEHSYGLLFLNHIYHALQTLPPDTDIVHNHCEYFAMHLLDSLKTPFLHTLHGSFCPDSKKNSDNSSINTYLETLSLFKNHSFISISNFQRQGNPNLNYIGNVYNGINIDDYSFYPTSQDHLSWLGRYSPIKGLDVAIKLAKTVGKKLIISASVHAQRQDDFDQKILPEIDGKYVILAEKQKNNAEKSKFYGDSIAFLFPIQWEEPFGLVLTEAMACGTPVIAYSRGSVPEIIKDGETGFLVNPSDNDIRGDWIIKKTGLEGLREAVERIYSLPRDKYLQMRKNARSHVEKSFTIDKMVSGYEEIYKKIISKAK